LDTVRKEIDAFNDVAHGQGKAGSPREYLLAEGKRVDASASHADYLIE